MTTPNEDLEQRVAELQREALSKNLTEKIIVVAGGHPDTTAKNVTEDVNLLFTATGKFGADLIKPDQSIVLRVGPSKESHFDAAEVIYKGKSTYYCIVPKTFSPGFDHIMETIHDYLYGLYSLQEFHEKCQYYLEPNHIQRYHPGDWEQVLDKIYEEALENIDNKKAENKRDEENKKRKEEEQRIKTLRENFG